MLGLLGFRALRFWRGFRVQGFRISDLGDRIRHFAFSGVPLFASLLQDAQKQIVTVFGAGVPDVNHLINPGDVRPVGTFVPGRAIAAFCIFFACQRNSSTSMLRQASELHKVAGLTTLGQRILKCSCGTVNQTGQTGQGHGLSRLDPI